MQLHGVTRTTLNLKVSAPSCQSFILVGAVAIRTRNVSVKATLPPRAWMYDRGPKRKRTFTLISRYSARPLAQWYVGHASR